MELKRGRPLGHPDFNYGNTCSQRHGVIPGFYLEYLRGISFPPKRPASTPKILSSLQYISNYSIGKSSRQDKVSAHEVSIPCLRTLYDMIVSQNAPDCISLQIHFKKFSGGGGGV